MWAIGVGTNRSHTASGDHEPRDHGAAVSEYLMIPSEPTTTAPDGSDVRVLLGTSRGTMAHFEFPPNQVAPAVLHRTVDEIWFFLGGTGRMWTSNGPKDGIDVTTGMCVTIPVGTAFQVRSHGSDPLSAVATTMPPWPGEGEAEIVEGPWTPTIEPGPH